VQKIVHHEDHEEDEEILKALNKSIFRALRVLRGENRMKIF